MTTTNGTAPELPLLHGVCAAMSSPFDDSGESIDEGRIRDHVEHSRRVQLRQDAAFVVQLAQ